MNKMNKMKTTTEKKETKPKVTKVTKVTKKPKVAKTSKVVPGQYELKKADLSDPKLNENENENETFEDVSKRIASEICSYIVDTSTESMDSCPQNDSCHYDDLFERVNNSLAKFEDVMEKHNDEFTEKMRDFNMHTKKEAFNSFFIGANVILFVGLIAKLFT